MRAFRGAPPPLPMPSNAEFAQDFMDLTFRMESGAPLPRFTRYEGPIRVGVAGPAAPTLERDLDALLGRLRREAGLDIARARGPEANVVIETVPRAAMRRLVPQAACFVVPNAASWDAYRRLRRSDAADWTLLARPRPHGHLRARRHPAPGAARLPPRGARAGCGALGRPLASARQRLQ